MRDRQPQELWLNRQHNGQNIQLQAPAVSRTVAWAPVSLSVNDSTENPANCKQPIEDKVTFVSEKLKTLWEVLQCKENVKKATAAWSCGQCECKKFTVVWSGGSVTCYSLSNNLQLY